MSTGIYDTIRFLIVMGSPLLLGIYLGYDLGKSDGWIQGFKDCRKSS